MDNRRIKNWDELATSENRKSALAVMEAAFQSIDTRKTIKDSIKLDGETLRVCDKTFDLAKFNTIKVVGFGKASIQAAIVLEEILGSRISEGAVIGLSKADCKFINTFSGTHPRPSVQNISAGKKIYEIAENAKEGDLLIVLVSGGGSALLCYSEEECDQHALLYDKFLKSGKTITEINTVRKHLSVLKGGGLAKIAYPATVIGLIFSDIPGDDFFNVASGPTYKDESTVLNAQNIIDQYHLGSFNLIETPKENKYFEKVHNLVLVSNRIAVDAMSKKAQELSFNTEVISVELYDEVSTAIRKIFNVEKEGTIVLAAGEPEIKVDKKGGQGGRNLHMGLKAIEKRLIDSDSVFISFSSDGMDNSDAAGAIVDSLTLEKARKLKLDAGDYASRFDSYNFFKQTRDLIMTGPTDANVSDLMLLLTKK